MRSKRRGGASRGAAKKGTPPGHTNMFPSDVKVYNVLTSNVLRDENRPGCRTDHDFHHRCLFSHQGVIDLQRHAVGGFLRFSFLPFCGLLKLLFYTGLFFLTFFERCV